MRISDKASERIGNIFGWTLVAGMIGTASWAGATVQTQQERNNTELQQVRQILNEFDTDKDGTLSNQELSNLANELAKLRKLQIK